MLALPSSASADRGRSNSLKRLKAPRLEWLISRYLLAEDMAAADWLTALRKRLRDELLSLPRPPG